MGLFQVQIEVLPADGGVPQVQSVLVDTGASYLALPRSFLLSLGYRAIDRQRVVFATGETAVWDVAEVRIRLQGRERTVLAFLASDESPRLLGAQTLETFGLGVDPLGKRLVPVDAYLAPGELLAQVSASGAQAEAGMGPRMTRRSRLRRGFRLFSIIAQIVLVIVSPVGAFGQLISEDFGGFFFSLLIGVGAAILLLTNLGRVPTAGRRVGWIVILLAFLLLRADAKLNLFGPRFRYGASKEGLCQLRVA